MYFVEWLPAAEQILADLWNNSSDRATIAAAADALDNSLVRNPANLGESRGGNMRIAFSKPLGILFNIDEAGRHVRVLGIWRWSS